MIYEKDDTKIKKIKLHLRQSTEKFPKIFYPKREKTTFSSSIIGYNFLNDKLYKDYLNKMKKYKELLKPENISKKLIDICKL